MLTQSIRNNGLVLALFALATSVLLASTYLGTRETIVEAERQAAARILLEIYPPGSHDNDLIDDTLPIPETYLGTLGLDEPSVIHVVKNEGEIVGFIIPSTAPDGYSGDIKLLTGINLDGSIAGVRTLAHTETPGLGDKIELRKSDWILSFNGRALGEPPPEQWKVTKDGGYFDQFTGATITPRAVVDRILKTLIFYREHREQLIKSARQST